MKTEINSYFIENKSIVNIKIPYSIVGKGSKIKVIFEDRESMDICISALFSEEKTTFNLDVKDELGKIKQLKNSATNLFNKTSVHNIFTCWEEQTCKNQFLSLIRERINKLENKENATALVYFTCFELFNHCPTQSFVNNILKEFNVKPKNKLKESWTNDEKKDISTILKLSKTKLGDLSDISLKNSRCEKTNDAYLAIAAKNLQDILNKNKSKLLKNKKPNVYANPKKREYNPYGNTSLRTDFAITYKEDNSLVGVHLEAHGWTNSEEYYKNQKNKVLLSAIETGNPMHMIITTKKNDVYDLTLPENYSELEERVYKWTLNNCIVASSGEFSIMDAMYKEITKMMIYAGLEQYMPTSVFELFKI